MASKRLNGRPAVSEWGGADGGTRRSASLAAGTDQLPMDMRYAKLVSANLCWGSWRRMFAH